MVLRLASAQTLMALLHVVIGDKNIDEEGSVELEQTRARLVETQNELDRVKETLRQREDDNQKLRQVSRPLCPLLEVV